MSYRRAWLLVQSTNEAAGQPLVEAAVGGLQGGGARLTPFGRQALTLFRQLQQHLQSSATALWPHLVQEAAAGHSVHVAAAVSLEDVLGQLLADFALHQPDVPVRTLFGASDELADHLLAGAAVDLFLAADGRHIDRLAMAGLIEPGSQTVLAENRLAVMGRVEGTVRPRKADDLQRANVTRIALAKPSSPLGGYSVTDLQAHRLYETLQSRVLFTDNARAVVAAVRSGRADVGLVYASSAVGLADCRILFQDRAEEVPIRIMAALVRSGQAMTRARILLDFLRSRTAALRFRRCGFLPARTGIGPVMRREI
jgi:molybdate transport system substrate-binding protein